MSPSELAKCRRVLTLMLAVAACGGAPDAYAHPHVWASVRSEIIFDANRQIVGVRQAWTFDEMYSAMAVQGLDADGDGAYSEAELKPLTDVNIQSLKEFDYFTFGKSGEAKFEFGPPADYWLEFKDKVLTLHFTLPVKAGAQKGGATFDVYDPTYFIAFSFAEKDAVKLVNAPASCKVEVKRPLTVSGPQQTESFFNSLSRGGDFNSQIANSAIVTCK